MTDRSRLLRFPLTFGMALALLGAVACSDDDSPTAPGPSAPTSLSGTLGPAGGTLESADGRLSLIVPAGALPADTEIRITEMLPAARRDLSRSPVGIFVTEPADLAFDEPVDVVLRGRVPTNPDGALEGSALLIRGITRDRLDAQQQLWDILAALQVLDEASGQSTITVTIDAFRSTLEFDGDWRDSDDQPVDVSVRMQALVDEPVDQGSPFTITARVETTGDLVFGDQGVFHALPADGATALTADQAVLTPTFGGTGGAGQDAWNFTLAYEASKQSAASIPVAMSYAVTPDPVALWSDPADRPVSVGTTRIRHELAATEVTLFPVTDPQDGWLEPGLYDVGPGPESGVAIGELTSWSLGGSVALTAATGSRFLSLRATTPLAVTNDDMVYPVGMYWGGLPVGVGDPEPAASSLWFFQYGQNGAEIVRWDAQGEFFGSGILAESGGSVTDAYWFGGNPWSGGLSYTTQLLGKVDLLEFDMQGGFSKTATLTNFPGAGGGPVTAAVLGGDMGALVVTDGMPGALWFHDLMDPFAAATEVGPVGDGPRRMRLVDDVALVSNQDSGTLTVIDTAPTLSIKGSYAVGSQPVGFEGRKLANDHIAVVVANYGEDSWSLMELMPDGTLVDVVTTPLTGGASGPVDAFWFPGGSTKFGVLCNGSGELFVGDSQLE